MKIYLADVSGFCLGVRRAVSQAEKLAAGGVGVNTLGPLIHNPQEVQRLREQGVGVIDSIDESSSGTVVVRAHGAPPEVYRQALENGINLVDATCPFVLSLQKKAMSLAEAGYPVIIVGDSTHPEVKGVVGWTGSENSYVVSCFDDLDRLPPLERAGVVAQTTQREEFVEAIVSILRGRVADLRVEKTICRATTERQEAARNLAGQVQVMLVIGGRASSNTQKLASICRDAGAVTHQIESAADINPSWFEGVDVVGITAGASTPDWIVKGVINRMEELVQLGGENGMGEQVEAKKEKSIESYKPESGQGVLEAEGIGEIKTFRPGQTVEGTIVQIAADHLLVDIGYKSEGVVPLSEISLPAGETIGSAFRTGQGLQFVVVGIDNQEGTLLLSQRRVREREAWRTLEKAHANQEVLEAPVLEVVKGGLLVDLGVRAFMPASQIQRGYVADLNEYVGQKVRCRIIEFDRANRRAVVSQKAVLEEEAQAKREKIWGEIEEGQIRTGTVKSITDFGAFIDLGGLDGLLHVSEISWGRVGHPSDVLSVGETVTVKVLKLDREREKISLGLKQVQPDPWDTVEKKYQPEMTVSGRVMRIVPFGVFVELEPGVEGLIHISQLADRRVNDPREVVQEGETVKVRVLKVSGAEKRISLSMREPKAMAQPERQRESAPAKRGATGEAIEVTAESAAGNAPTFESVTLGDVFGDVLKQSRSRSTQDQS